MTKGHVNLNRVIIYSVVAEAFSGRPKDCHLSIRMHTDKAVIIMKPLMKMYFIKKVKQPVR